MPTRAIYLRLPQFIPNPPALQAEDDPVPKKRRRTEVANHADEQAHIHAEDESTMDIDIEAHGMDDRHPSTSADAREKAHSRPRPQSLVREPSYTASSHAQTSSRKVKKHRNVVYSDDDDDDDDGILAAVAASASNKDDADDEFMPSSPRSPPREANALRKPVKGPGPKVKKTSYKTKAGEAPITFRDQRRLDVPAVELTPKDTGPSQPIGGNKRSRTADDADFEPDPPATADVPPVDVQEEEKPLLPPPKKKFPTIKKKNKSGPALPPPASTSASASVVPSLPAKPPPPTTAPPTQPALPANARKPTAESAAADVDLMNADVYASLFSKNATGQAPRAGLGQREKELERRRDLERMRDEARNARLAELDRTAFDLSFAQEKVASYEAMLKERNSVALFPHHLASYLKHNAKKL